MKPAALLVLAFLVWPSPAAGEQATLVAWHRSGVPLAIEVAPGSHVEYAVQVTTLFGTRQRIVGRNRAVSGTIHWRPGAAGGEVVADAARFDSGNPVRDAHVRELIDAEAYPEIHFQVRAIEELGPAPPESLPGLAVVGTLRMRGYSVPLRARVEPLARARHVQVEGATTFDFADVGMQPPTLLGFVKRAEAQLFVRAHLVGEARPRADATVAGTGTRP